MPLAGDDDDDGRPPETLTFDEKKSLWSGLVQQAASPVPRPRLPPQGAPSASPVRAALPIVSSMTALVQRKTSGDALLPAASGSGDVAAGQRADAAIQTELPEAATPDGWQVDSIDSSAGQGPAASWDADDAATGDARAATVVGARHHGDAAIAVQERQGSAAGNDARIAQLERQVQQLQAQLQHRALAQYDLNRTTAAGLDSCLRSGARGSSGPALTSPGPPGPANRHAAPAQPAPLGDPCSRAAWTALARQCELLASRCGHLERQRAGLLSYVALLGGDASASAVSTWRSSRAPPIASVAAATAATTGDGGPGAAASAAGSTPQSHPQQQALARQAAAAAGAALHGGEEEERHERRQVRVLLEVAEGDTRAASTGGADACRVHVRLELAQPPGPPLSQQHAAADVATRARAAAGLAAEAAATEAALQTAAAAAAAAASRMEQERQWRQRSAAELAAAVRRLSVAVAHCQQGYPSATGADEASAASQAPPPFAAAFTDALAAMREALRQLRDGGAFTAAARAARTAPAAPAGALYSSSSGGGAAAPLHKRSRRDGHAHTAAPAGPVEAGAGADADSHESPQHAAAAAAAATGERLEPLATGDAATAPATPGAAPALASAPSMPLSVPPCSPRSAPCSPHASPEPGGSPFASSSHFGGAEGGGGGGGAGGDADGDMHVGGAGFDLGDVEWEELAAAAAAHGPDVMSAVVALLREQLAHANMEIHDLAMQLDGLSHQREGLRARADQHDAALRHLAMSEGEALLEAQRLRGLLAAERAARSRLSAQCEELQRRLLSGAHDRPHSLPRVPHGGGLLSYLAVRGEEEDEEEAAEESAESGAI